MSTAGSIRTAGRSVLRAVDRAYAVPPLLWVVLAYQWLAYQLWRPFAPAERRFRERNARELDELAALCASVGRHDSAERLRAAAAAWRVR